MSEQHVLPFLTVTKNLTANKCWLCEQTFPRGLTKRVFQIQNLLDYFNRRYLKEKELAATASTESTDGATAAVDSLPPLRTKNFSDCYNLFKEEMDTHGNIEALVKELRENDLDVWMSGLICALHGGCEADSSLFIESSSKPSNKAKPTIPLGITFANKDCPPNCGCDNPWAFLS